jgi:hypothetical protein
MHQTIGKTTGGGASGGLLSVRYTLFFDVRYPIIIPPASGTAIDLTISFLFTILVPLLILIIKVYANDFEKCII